MVTNEATRINEFQKKPSKFDAIDSSIWIWLYSQGQAGNEDCT
jgi:hypothetical protein